jgi:hypothetical protein
VLKETDNCHDQPYAASPGSVTVTAGTDGRQGGPAGNFTEPLHLISG